MYHSLYFNLNAPQNKASILKMFFEDWADGVYAKEIIYSTVATNVDGRFPGIETIRVDFENEEDAAIMKLKGIPEEFQKHLRLVDSSYAS